MLAHPVDGAV